jgi:hypothetical protein
MFSKRKYQVFTHYHHTDNPDRWESDLSELKNNGFGYLIVSEGFDLKNILATDAQKDLLIRFLDAAHAHEVACVINPGNPRELYILPDARRWRLDYIRHVAEALGDHPAVYALMLEDGPSGGANASFERWKTVTAELEGRIESDNLTGDGYQYAVKKWQMEQYADYTQELVTVIKKARSRLKTTICFQLDGLFPTESLVHYQNTAQHLDFVMIDSGPKWIGDAKQRQSLPSFAASVASGLVDKPIWFLVGSHVENTRYRPELRDLRDWTRQVALQGITGIGWRGWDGGSWKEPYQVRGAPLAETRPEYWKTMLALSRDISDTDPVEKSFATHVCLLTYDGFINRLAMDDIFVVNETLRAAGIAPLSYVSDTQLLAKKGLQKRKVLYISPCPAVSGPVIDQMRLFMESGGWIIASGDDGALDEQMLPSETRSQMFGIEDEEPMLHDDRILLGVSIGQLSEGASLPSAWFRSRLTTLRDDVRILGRWGDGSPAITLTGHGKGGVLYVGTDLYRSAAQADTDWTLFLEAGSDTDTLKELAGGAS